jgi:hypothetical protein
MRTITTHTVKGLNEAITITVLDEPGAGGACHQYHLHIPRDGLDLLHWDLHFQEGPIAEAGANGVSNEALLAVVRDRLACFQAGPYACQENAEALDAVIMAMDWLHMRTEARLRRGVEGTSTV